MLNTTTISAVLSTPNTKSEQAGPTATNFCPSRLGDMAERWVSLLASWKGAEVFPNINSTGNTDLVIRYEGQIYELDVKCSTWREDKQLWDPKNTWLVKAPVIPVIVEPDGDIANWRVRWARGKAPAGLENFWKTSPRTAQ